MAESSLKSRQEAIYSLCLLTRWGLEGSAEQKCHHHHPHHFHDPHSHKSCSVTYLVWFGPKKKVGSSGITPYRFTKGKKAWSKENHSLGGARKLVLAPAGQIFALQGLCAQTPNMRGSIGTSYDFRLLRRFGTAYGWATAKCRGLLCVVALSRLTAWVWPRVNHPDRRGNLFLSHSALWFFETYTVWGRMTHTKASLTIDAETEQMVTESTFPLSAFLGKCASESHSPPNNSTSGK